MNFLIDPGLSGKVALVTGGNNPYGIGAATAKALARLGAPVLIHFFRPPGPATPLPETPGEAFYRAAQARSGAEVAEEIRAAGGRAEAWEADLSRPAAIPELFDRAEAAFGPVEILVNNAAHSSFDTFLPGAGDAFAGTSEYQASPVSAQSHDESFAVNSRAPALLMAELARRLTQRGATWGRIVNISTDGSSGHAGSVSYGASKHALESYSRAAAYELGRFGITVNVIAPGPIQTGWMPPELAEQVCAAIPLGRVGAPEDIADAVVFFASEQARWITGQTLYVGGGHVMPL